MLNRLRWQLVLAAGGVLVIGALLYLLSDRTFSDRPARGGQFVEAFVGRPATFNPLFARSDVETDMARLLFSGLARTDADGNIRPDLAQWDISDDGLTYTFQLREDIAWHDGQPVTADDVLFTARLAADRQLAGALSDLAVPWSRAQVERVDARTVRFTLDEPYAPFLGAAMLGLLPAHRLESVPVTALETDRFSTLEPIGAGPYQLLMPGGLDNDAVRLTRFDGHWAATDRKPYIDTLVFQFHPAQAPEEALQALGQQSVQALGGLPAEALDTLAAGTGLYSTIQSSYTLVYLNLSNLLFQDLDVRRALSLALDREALIAGPPLSGQAIVAASPIAPGWWAHDAAAPAPRHDPAQARRILDEAGWIDSDDDGVRDRDGKPLSFSIEIPDDPALHAVGERLATDWSAVGVAVERRFIGQQSALANLTNRSYDAMLWAWDLRAYDPDPYPLWHSSQASAPGQNFSGFADQEADEILAQARRVHDVEQRALLYGRFQRLFTDQVPALMLYHPAYAYGVIDTAVGGVQLPRLLVEPADRFLTLPDWFVETERVLIEGRP